MTDEGNQDPNAGAGEGDGKGKSGNPDPNQGGQGSGDKWYSTLEGDLANHPAITKFENPSALAKSYIEVEKLTGYEKVVKPKGPEDLSGWARFNEAMGVPKDPNTYLPKFADPKDVPQGMSFNKENFAKAVHEMGLRPDQAEKAWRLYTDEYMSGYNQQVEASKESLNASETALRKEWGQQFDHNISLATKFVRMQITDDAEFEKFNERYSRDPVIMKMFAKAGKDYSENQIGGFKDAGSNRMTPQQAQEEYDSIVNNPKDDYYNDVNSIRQRRIKYVESLIEQGADPTKIG